jgi:hypothetical protein
LGFVEMEENSARKQIQEKEGTNQYERHEVVGDIKVGSLGGPL